MKTKNLAKLFVCFLMVFVNVFIATGCGGDSPSSASPSSSASTSVHSHAYGQWDITKPTQTETGLAKKVCSGCAETDQGHEISVTLPILTDSAYQKGEDSATCVDSGKINYSITLDGESFSFFVPTMAKGHSYGQWISEVPATAEASGVLGHYKCGVCAKVFDENKKLIVSDDLTIPQLWTYDETHHWHGESKADIGEHSFDNGVETEPATYDKDGVKTYTCTICKKTKTETIPKLSETSNGALSEDTQVLFTAAETLTGEKQLCSGVKVVATPEKIVDIVASVKGREGIDFTHTLKLGGKINNNSRYIQITVAKACTLKVYALSGATSEARNLNVYSSLEDVTDTGILLTQTVAAGSSISVLQYALPQAGTYYLGSGLGGINIYGLVFTFAEEKPGHNFATEWTHDETHHWVDCQDELCEEVDLKGEHVWGAGVETKPATETEVGEMTYTCTICSRPKTEEIPKLDPAPVVSAISENADITFSATTDLTQSLVPGVKVVQTAEKAVTLTESYKGKDGLTFTHAINLGGKINADSRYIEVTTADGPFTLKIYALSGSSTTDRALMLLNSLTDVTATGAIQTSTVKGGSKLTVFEFSLATPGTYYIGSQSGAIYVYGIFASKGLHSYPSTFTHDETHHWRVCSDGECGRIIDYDEHAWGAGVETKPATETEVGEMTYACTVCGRERKEEIPKLDPGAVDAITEDTSILFSSTTDLTQNLAPGVKVVQTAEKAVTLISSSKSKDGIDFTHAIGLGGKINADSRYIEMKVNGPCTIKMYAVSKTTSSATTMMMFNSLADVTETGAITTAQIASGSALSVIEFTITEAGTYYFGSKTGGINVYGIYVSMT